LGMSQPQSARFPQARFYSPHASKAMQSKMMFPDRLLGNIYLPNNGYSYATWSPKPITSKLLPGNYYVWVCFASIWFRPLDLYVDGIDVYRNLAWFTTPSQYPRGRRVDGPRLVPLPGGATSISLQRNEYWGAWPHFHQMVWYGPLSAPPPAA